jgi:hypothetical protein
MRKYGKEFKQNAGTKILDGQSAAGRATANWAQRGGVLHNWKKAKFETSSNLE